MYDYRLNWTPLGPNLDSCLKWALKKNSTLGKARNGFQGIQKSKKLKLASNNFDTVHRGHCTFVKDISLF